MSGRLNIKRAIKRPGSLRSAARKAHAIKKDGTIKVSWIRKAARRPGKLGQRARFALVLRKMHHR